MIKLAITIGAAAMLAGVLTILPGMAPNVEAGTPAVESAPLTTEVPAAKQDRLPVASGVPCAQRAWPYYGQDCVVDFDSRFRGEPRKVRLVTTDRLQ